LLLDRERSHSGDQHALLKAAEISSSSDLTYRILILLNLLPLTLFQGAPTDVSEHDKYFEENFAYFVACLDTDDERVRYLTGSVARKLMSDGSVFLLRKSLESGSQTFQRNFWRST
jgi:neurofibromin 1